MSSLSLQPRKEWEGKKRRGPSPHCAILPLVRFPGVGGLSPAQDDSPSQMAGTGPHRGSAGDGGCFETSSLLWSRGRTTVCVLLIPESRAVRDCWPLGSKGASVQGYVPTHLGFQEAPVSGALLISAQEIGLTPPMWRHAISLTC